MENADLEWGHCVIMKFQPIEKDLSFLLVLLVGIAVSRRLGQEFWEALRVSCKP